MTDETEPVPDEPETPNTDDNTELARSDTPEEPS